MVQLHWIISFRLLLFFYVPVRDFLGETICAFSIESETESNFKWKSQHYE